MVAVGLVGKIRPAEAEERWKAVEGTEPRPCFPSRR